MTQVGFTGDFQAYFRVCFKPGEILVKSVAGVVLPGSHALGKPVIRENFNGSYGLYERLVISEGILKQTCSEL